MTGRMVRNTIGWVLGSSKVEKSEDPDAREAAEEDLEAWTSHLLDATRQPQSGT